MHDPFVLVCRGRTVDCRIGRSGGACIAGILNVTPDSFSDGGRYVELPAAVDRAKAMWAEGAEIIDVGGASSRPAGRTYGAGAALVPAEEETRRVVPVVEAIAADLPEAIISVDTFRFSVAREALRAGAHLINDITGLRAEPRLASVVADAGAGLILMHSVGAPGRMPHAHTYGDLLADVTGVLAAAVDSAHRAGVRSIAIDPGFGFGKSPADNLRLIRCVDELLGLGRPVMVGVSRKSTLGIVLGSPDHPAPVSDRLFAGLGVTAMAVERGATIVRTHDVQPTRDLLRATWATSRGEEPFARKLLSDD